MGERKRLGQHFLINKNKLQKIVEVLDLKPGETVIEIGPGHGELTNELRIKNYELRIIAIEKDKNLVENLEFKIKNLGIKNIEIIKDDALRILSALPKTYNLKPYTYKVVGDIPYYITGRLLRILGELKNKPSLIVLTIQKEVAERICAEPPKMNLLAASVQFWAEPEIIDYIPKKDFRPQPKVDSAIIKLKSITINMRSHEKCYEIGAKEYYKLIKILFKQPRKTILNNLIFNSQFSIFKKEDILKKLQELGINPNDRPQNLSVEKIKQLSKIIKV